LPDQENNEKKMLKTWLNMSENQVVIVVFSAPWSGATHILNTYLKAVKQEFPDIYTDYVDIEKSNELASEFGIRQIPTIVVLKDSEIKDYIVGIMSRKNLRSWIESHL
jgi:thioredoxin 1